MAEWMKAIKRLEYVGKSLIKLFIEDCAVHKCKGFCFGFFFFEKRALSLRRAK